MDKASFRDILAQFLEEKSENVITEAVDSPLKNVELDPFSGEKWGNFSSTTVFASLRHHSRAKVAYPKVQVAKSKNKPNSPSSTAAESPPSAPAKPPVAEYSIALETLSATDLKLVERLLQMGGQELKQGLSASRLKRVHRRLIRQLHPDAQAGRHLSHLESKKRHEGFLEVQKAYERLHQILQNESSARARDNESASAAESPHRAAA